MPSARYDKMKSDVAGAIDRQEAARRIDRYIAEQDDWRGEKLARLRRLIHQAIPDIIEDWKWMGTPVWARHGMRLPSTTEGMMCLSARARATFGLLDFHQNLSLTCVC